MKRTIACMLMTMLLLCACVPAHAAEWTVTESAEMTDAARETFEKATQKLLGMTYDPVALLAEKDGSYCILCRATAVYPEAEPSYSLVYVGEDGVQNVWELWIEKHSTPEGASRETARFSYDHDPRENPEAMKDIVENDKAVYGFSPDPASTRLGSYAQYDWTDPAFVSKAKEERKAYHDSLDSMTDILLGMREEGASVEEMARAVSAERNRLRLAAYQDDPEGLAEVKESNLKTYGHEDGPTADELYEKYASWETVLQKAFGANLGMDVCCGLYDEYYQLYIELGYVEEKD